VSTYTKILDEALIKFKEAHAAVLDVLEPCAHASKTDDLNGIIDMYLRLEQVKDMCDILTKASNIHQPELAENAANMMMTTDTEAIIRGGYTIRPDTKTYVSVNKDNKPYVLMWLKNHPEGRELVGEDYNANAFSAFIRGLIEEKGYSKDSEDLAKKLPTEISTFDKPVLQLRKKKA
jgi:hypothetical protein